MIVDGKALAEEIKQDLRARARGKDLHLAVVWVGEDPVSERYVERKKKLGLDLGIEVVVYEYPSTILEGDLIEEINRLVADDKINGIIVQLPLVGGIDEQKILDLISPEKDVDALGQEPKVLPPTVGAIKYILEKNNVSLAGKNVVILGKGKLVGRPVAIWLTQAGANVAVIDSRTSDSESVNLFKTADIIVSGVGKSDLITPDKIKEGVILIDAGTSESSGQLVGDANPACADKCSLFTPVPGGVGPLTVVMLFKNLLELNK
ncbi:MAG TPA: bifunctional 5,10-methylenetetrahydrofolate dehydrogenase/5,10-methenyltetrahydrofolate cyclohydrolase [Candidatus Paceibacterota bacterium]|nr:bifunctional 5,10-methylenetetrahydrofolate dehydrogenase/5,10-methenyltetrahydrofolate cyclohydrolase [Candidatus Paceibacterota bacterium]